VLVGNAPFIQNWLNDGQEYDLDVYLSNMDSTRFFKPKGRHRAPVDKAKPIWSLKNITYSQDGEHGNTLETMVDLDLDMIQREVVVRNETLYVHARISFANPFHTESLMNERHK